MAEKDEMYRILDAMRVNVYVTDIETDEIIFMNHLMKNTYHKENVEGRKCYEELQDRQDELCSFCPKKQLKELGQLGKCVEWVENNHKVNRIFKNYDCLIPWIDGRIVHMQQSVDITDTIELNKQAKMDDLCGMLNRRAGKERLREALKEAKQKQKALQVVLLDVDHLKETNDIYGHKEGDFLLKELSNKLKQQLIDPEFMFRLSGDEFVIVSSNKDDKEMAKFMLECLEKAKQLKMHCQKEYEFSFCFGIYSVHGEHTLDVNDIIAKADEQMYEQKLRFRKTRMAELNENPFRHSTAESEDFEYDSTQLYDALMKSTDDFIYICNMKTGVFRYSPAQVQLLNLPSQIIADPLPVWKQIVHPQDWDRFYRSNMEIGENQKDYHSVEFRAKTCHGEYIWLKCRGQLMRDSYGEPSMFAGIMTQLDRLNKIDALTHLFNRHELNKAGREKIKDKAVDSLALMILDIDDFKNVNELYDRSFGDKVLKSTAQMIQSNLPGNASLYKLDNDQMGVLIENCQIEDIHNLYQTIQKQLLRQQLQEHYDCQIQISAGCAMAPIDANEFEELYTYADYAMQNAKANGKNQLCMFDPSISKNKERALEILRNLRESVRNHFQNFNLVFQPQMDAKTIKTIGVEALLRWHCDSLGTVSPMEFIPILEANALMSDVGAWVLRTAIQKGKEWIRLDPKFTISVNVSALQVLNGEFAKRVKRILEEEAFPAQNLILELTESNTISNMRLFEKEFDQLKQMGIRLAMDDFGTGYSSLENLKHGVANVVKIDRAFVKDIQKSQFDTVLISFIIAICHSVDIAVCLEGIETKKEWQLVESMGLDCYQGYLFGKPMTTDDISERLRKERTMVE